MKTKDYAKYYIQGSDHYLLPKDIFVELFNELNNWKAERKKKQDVIDRLANIIYEIDDCRKSAGGYPSDYIDKLVCILNDDKEV